MSKQSEKIIAEFSDLYKQVHGEEPSIEIFNRHHVSEMVLKITNSVHKVNSITKILIKEFLLVKF